VLRPGSAALVCALWLLLPAAPSVAAPTRGVPQVRGLVYVQATLAYEHATVAGTGILLGSSGEVLTNNHVIRGATRVRVTVVATGRTYAAIVRGYSAGADIALLQVGGTGFVGATLGRSSGLTPGARVTAIGNAGGTGRAPTTAAGRITALKRPLDVNDDFGNPLPLRGLIETDLPLRPGDSGGPLLDDRGRVVGVNTAAIGSARQPAVGGRSFAIPIDAALRIVRRIEAGRSSPAIHVGPTAFLGVGVADAADAPSPAAARGALVAAVVPGTPAAQVGLANGDVITSVAGVAVATASELTSAVLRHGRPGATIVLRWVDRFGLEHRGAILLVSGPPQ